MKSETKIRILGYFGLFLVTCVITWLLTETGHCQVPVAFAPPIHFQFFNASGQPLANGKIFTYAAGTTSCQNTYTDATGTVQNPCVILLDATGSPANGSNQVGIFLANFSYKFVAFDVNNVQQWSVDNVTSYFALLNSTNTWTAAQTFTQPITDTLTDNQLIFGTLGNQTTLDFPPPASNITLHMPSTADTIVGRATTDTLTNKTLTNPNFNGVCSINGGPGAYACLANNAFLGTTLNTLTHLTNLAAAQIASITDTSGIVGICISNCSTTGTAVIQESGQATCIFDGSTLAGDYVQISSTVAGNCHDAGASAPVGTQNIGRVLATGVGGATKLILFGSEILVASSSVRVISTDGTPITASAATTGVQPVKISSAFAAGSLNHLQATFRATMQINVVPGGGASNQSLFWGISNSAGLTSPATDAILTTSANSTSLSTDSTVTCVVTAVGASGTFNCSILTTSSLGTVTGFAQWSPSIDLTQTLYVGNLCSFSVASVANTCAENLLTVERLN